MKVPTAQPLTFADAIVPIPENELSEIDQLIDWKPIHKCLMVTKTDYSPLLLFKSLLLRDWYDLSYERLASCLGRDIVFMKFCGYSLEGEKPNATTLERFRDRLIKHDLWKKLLLMINQDLESQGLKVSSGKHVSMDATLVQSSRRPRKVYPGTKQENQVDIEKVEYSDDTDASWLKKGDKTVYGYQATVTSDTQGMIEDAVVSPANESEMSNFPEVLEHAKLGKGTRVLYDKGVDSKANHALLKEKGYKDGIMRKKPRAKEQCRRELQRNKAISKRRFVVERTFGTLKRVYGFSRAKLLGLAKVTSEAFSKAIAYNIKRALNYQRQLASLG